MNFIKISLITVVYNGEKYLRDCIRSVRSQTYPNLEYIIVDGGSTDHTLSIIEEHQNTIDHYISEKDQGMYHALNKGIAMASGEVIGILNADDVLVSSDTISLIANQFERFNPDGVYGNLNYVSENRNSIIRKWESKSFKPLDIVNGWMPAHPTLYLKKELFKQFGGYSLDYGSAADYELMLRFLYKHKIKAIHLNERLVDMRIGGMSNASITQRYQALKNDYRAIKDNGIPFAMRTLLFKKLSKIPQFFV